MRLALVTKRSDLQRLRSFDPEAYVLLEDVDVEGKRLLPEDLPEEFMVLEEPPFGILDDLRGSLEVRELVFYRRPKFAIFKRPDVPGSVEIEGITFVNASRGAIIDGDKVILPRVRRSRVLYTLTPETPRTIPRELLEKPARLRDYNDYEDPHIRRVIAFARAYMERRVIFLEPQDDSMIREALEVPGVFFDLEFDARALKGRYEEGQPIIRVASIHDGKLHRFFIRTLDEERRFLEFLARYDSIIGYGTHGDVKILRLAAERHGVELPKVYDLRERLFPKDPKKQRIALPCGRKTGLKTVATSLGFRRGSDKDGYRAYKTYLKARSRGRPEILVKQLLYYNAEDTLMTLYVRKKTVLKRKRVKGLFSRERISKRGRGSSAW